MCTRIENEGFIIVKKRLLLIGLVLSLLLTMVVPGTSDIELHKHMQKRRPSLSKKGVLITGDIMGWDTRDFLIGTEVHEIVKPFSADQLRK